jgi:hypothetical protein
MNSYNLPVERKVPSLSFNAHARHYTRYGGNIGNIPLFRIRAICGYDILNLCTQIGNEYENAGNDSKKQKALDFKWNQKTRDYKIDIFRDA